MKISVITINLNNRKGLARTLESVKIQETAPFECIVIDGGSDDGSRELIRNSEIVSKYVSEKDKGIYEAMNKGLDLCAGDYVYFLNSGDEFCDKTVLSKIANSGIGTDLIYGNTLLNNAGKTRLVPPKVLDIPFFITGTLWHPCVFTARKVFEKCGKFRAELKITGDYEFFIRALFVHDCSYCYTDVDVSLFDVSGVSNNPASSEQEKSERKKSWEMNFSASQIKSFEELTRVQRSSEYKWGTLLKKILRPFSK